MTAVRRSSTIREHPWPEARCSKRPLAHSIHMSMKAIISGGGIGGLATAAALAQRGWEATVYESNPTMDSTSMTESSHGVLGGFVAALASGSIRVVDLTQTLSSAFPTIVLPAPHGQARPFELEEISATTNAGRTATGTTSAAASTAARISMRRSTGSPVATCRTTRSTPLPCRTSSPPACVIDCSEQAAADPDYLMTVADIENHEKLHGRIPEGWWALMRTDWSKRTDPKAFVNRDHTGQHTPGPSEEAVRLLVHDRKVMGFGTESISTDAGMAASFSAPHPCHSLVHGAGRHGLQCLTNLDQLPDRGALIVCPPLKILNGSGSPVRVLALVEGAADTSR